MVGAPAQLAAFGAADQYLSAQPQITYFKQIWRRYTQFATEAVEQSWLGDVDFGKKATVSLSKAGDLVTEVWVQIRLPDLSEVTHITNATRTATEPVIRYARSLSQTSMKVIAFTCNNATDYLLSCLASSGGVTSARMGGSSGSVSIVTSASRTAVTLVSVSDPAVTIAATGSGQAWTASGLTPGTTYAVCLDGNTASRDALVQLRTNVTGSEVEFAVTGASHLPNYRAVVSTHVSNAAVTSVEQDVLKLKWCNSVGHALISSVEWEMGGSRIDRHTGEHFDMWSELTEPEEKRAGYSEMIGRFERYDINLDDASSGGARTLYVPMRFTFNTSPSNALPLLALQFHDCRLNFEFRSFWELIKTNVPIQRVAQEPSIEQAKLFATYVFLSQDERGRFAQMPHEYLIEQVQAQVENVSSTSSTQGVVNRKITLALNHPIKELVWVYQASSATAKDTVTGNDWFNYDIPGYAGQEIFEEANIQFNGHDRFVKRPAQYFRLVQPWSHHKRCPTKRVHCYSFALHPEAQMPSGAANFSRIDSAHLSLALNGQVPVPAGRLRIHAVGYNILRIAQGLSGLVFTI